MPKKKNINNETIRERLMKIGSQEMVNIVFDGPFISIINWKKNDPIYYINSVQGDFFMAIKMFPNGQNGTYQYYAISSVWCFEDIKIPPHPELPKTKSVEAKKRSYKESK